MSDEELARALRDALARARTVCLAVKDAGLSVGFNPDELADYLTTRAATLTNVLTISRRL